MIDTGQILEKVHRIEGRYNGDNDIIPGAPVVQWADMELVQIVKQPALMVEDLQTQLNSIV